jgi:hypothetical protein
MSWDPYRTPGRTAEVVRAVRNWNWGRIANVIVWGVFPFACAGAALFCAIRHDVHHDQRDTFHTAVDEVIERGMRAQ